MIPSFPESAFQRVLCVVAHPDDVEYGTSSAVARWTSQGVEVAYLLLTRGEAGMPTPPEETARIRRGEQYAHAYERLFGTPHHVDLAALCQATRTPHWRVDSAAELDHALASPNGGIEVIEAVVRRDNRRELDERIRALAVETP